MSRFCVWMTFPNATSRQGHIHMLSGNFIWEEKNLMKPPESSFCFSGMLAFLATESGYFLGRYFASAKPATVNVFITVHCFAEVVCKAIHWILSIYTDSKHLMLTKVSPYNNVCFSNINRESCFRHMWPDQGLSFFDDCTSPVSYLYWYEVMICLPISLGCINIWKFWEFWKPLSCRILHNPKFDLLGTG